ncbi:cupin domain-containing protein [Candidatus Rariloculus sp.]|uniref:cupin domain-containing protein n=1 Tax=Candidatus Rariloculus sp. TaxID=3101265 RepID=UPI003D0C13D8
MGKSLFLLVLAALCIWGVATLAQGVRILDEAPLDRAADFPREDLVALFRQMSEQSIRTMRLLEGGEYNVNIRHVENVTPETFVTLVHPDTIDVWVVQEGSGTLLTGGEKDGDRQIGGVERFIGTGDLIFIPAGVPHGMKETSSITWLNIRFPEHRN